MMLRLITILLVLHLASPCAMATSASADIRSLELIDQDGKPFKLADTLGRTLVLNFIFTGCGDICPTQTADLAEIQRQLPAELRSHVTFISVSIDPDHDIPNILREYGDNRHVDFGMAHFLTGSRDAIDRIIGFYAAPRPTGSAPLPVTQHDATVHLIDASGQGRMRYSGLPLDTARLAQDIAAVAASDLSAR